MGFRRTLQRELMNRVSGHQFARMSAATGIITEFRVDPQAATLDLCSRRRLRVAWEAVVSGADELRFIRNPAPEGELSGSLEVREDGRSAWPLSALRSRWTS